MSRWEKYRASRTSWGINVLGSFCVEIEGTDGTVGFATGFGGMELARPQKTQD
jgi:L-rhamnonate dehydratase